MTGANVTSTLRWKDFEDSERWKVALGVLWRVLVLSIGLSIAVSVIIGIAALVLLSIGNAVS